MQRGQRGDVFARQPGLVAGQIHQRHDLRIVFGNEADQRLPLLALRVQLAVVSLAVGTCCWNAWRAPDVPGGVRWVTWSALAIGMGAGIRPETGPLLFPLWAACALRAPLSWRQRGKALGIVRRR